MFQTMPLGAVYLYEKDHVRLVAAVGRAHQFEPLKAPALLEELGNKPLPEYSFTWSDLNDDGQVQAVEVRLTHSPQGSTLTNFNRDLGVQGGKVRYQVREYLPSGVPVYEEVPLATLTGDAHYRFNDGTYYRYSAGSQPDGGVTAKGGIRWTYPQEGWGVQSLQTAKPYHPGQVVSQFGVVGHETAPQLGEFLVVHSNNGAWNVWTSDGILAGPIFRDLRDQTARPWSMPEHAGGQVMTDLTAGQEHFSGAFCKTSDGKFYVVAGHNHVSVLEVLGLDKFQRSTGEFEVTKADLEQAKKYDTSREQSQVYARAPIIDAYRVEKPPEMDGKLTGFGPAVSHLETGAALYMAYVDDHLYVAYTARGQGPLQNTGADWQRIFKSGAACDLLLATDPQAPANRQLPAAGDIRVLMTYVDKKPLTVLYRPIAPEASANEALRVTSPVGETIIDQVQRLSSARLVRTVNKSDPNLYILEAAIPLADIGLKVTDELRLKIDWGLLVSGPEGTDVLRRVYWANRATQIVADAPSEARLTPHLWGTILFHDQRPASDATFADEAIDGSKKPSKDQKNAVNELLDELKSK